MKAVIFVSLFLTALQARSSTETVCYKGWDIDWHLGANRAYSKANLNIGDLQAFEEHSCTGWNTGYWDAKVSVRPIYNDLGLPVYEIFREEMEELVGFEFRIYDPCLRNGWGGHNGFSISLSEEDRLYKDLTNAN